MTEYFSLQKFVPAVEVSASLAHGLRFNFPVWLQAGCSDHFTFFLSFVCQESCVRTSHIGISEISVNVSVVN